MRYEGPVMIVAEWMPKDSALVCSKELVGILQRHVVPTPQDIEDAREMIRKNPNQVVLITNIAEIQIKR